MQHGRFYQDSFFSLGNFSDNHGNSLSGNIVHCENFAKKDFELPFMEKLDLLYSKKFAVEARSTLTQQVKGWFTGETEIGDFASPLQQVCEKKNNLNGKAFGK